MRSWPWMLIFLAIVLATSYAAAQSPETQIDAGLSPRTVEVGETFRYQVTLTTQGAKSIDVLGGPEFGDQLQLLGSQRAPTFMSINGVVQRQLSVTYTFRALKKGKFTIRSPKFRSGSARLEAKPQVIRVVPEGSVKRTRTAAKKSKKYFIEANLEPSDNVYVGQQITLDYTLYVDARQMGVRTNPPESPELDDFWIEELTQPKRSRRQTKTINGRVMTMNPIRSYALFPLKAGPATIEEMELSVLASGFFFRPGKEHHVGTEAIQINVLPLPPDAPPGFYEGNVGDWKLSIRTDTSVARVGSPITVDIKVTGEGQASRVHVPRIPELQDFRVGEPTESSLKSIRGRRLQGEKTLTYTLTPLKEGKFTIPALEFPYFNPEIQKYQISKTAPVALKIAAGTLPPEPIKRSELTKRATSSTEDLVEGIVNLLPDPQPMGTHGVRSAAIAHAWWYWLLLGFTVLLNLALIIEAPIQRRRAAARPEKERRAQAERLLAALQQTATVQETSQAIRAFLREAHGLSPGQLSVDRISDSLVTLGLSQRDASVLESIVRSGDDARFSPDATATTSESEKAYLLLSKLKPSVKKRRGSKTAATSLILLLATPAFAAPSPRADYDAGNFEAAAAGYAKLAAANPDDANIWLNLAIARARNGEFPAARLAIEKASLRAPDDANIQEVAAHLVRIIRLQSIESQRRSVAIEGDESLFWWRVASGINRNVPPLLLLLSLGLLAIALLVRRQSQGQIRRMSTWAGWVFVVCSSALGGVWLARAQVLTHITPVIVVSNQPDYREGPSKHSTAVRRPKGVLPGVMLRQLESRDKWVKVNVSEGHVWLPAHDVVPID